ncbi:single-stranded DNA-binding protein [Nocardia arthritidis]|uniref:single-stranded DNA-binding protein n=1 Tax=Nocardia arthritidis TaxID=228602 RepID=UPI00142E5A65|nr:single-stranded DNA-binding protein [Nocardia arthritidis]
MTVAGNLTADPETRFTPNSNQVTHFTIASTPRVYNQQTQQWDDGETSFVRCQVWRNQAENVAESLHKGDRVVVTGTFAQRSWVDENQQKHSVWELQADDVAASMKFARVQVQRQRANQREGQSNSSRQQATTEGNDSGLNEFKPDPAKKPAARKQQMQATA